MIIKHYFTEKEVEITKELVLAFSKESKGIEKLFAGDYATNTPFYTVRAEKMEKGAKLEITINEDFYIGYANMFIKNAKKIKRICKRISSLIVDLISLNTDMEKDFANLVREIRGC